VKRNDLSYKDLDSGDRGLNCNRSRRVSAVFGDSSTPVNFVGVNFSPITTTISYNHDFLTGEIIADTAIASIFSTANVFQALVSDPTPPRPEWIRNFYWNSQTY